MDHFDINTVRQIRKPGFHLTAGTGYTWISGYGGGMESWIAPSLQYPVSGKLLLEAGLLMIHSGFPAFSNFSEGTGYYGNNFRMAVYGSTIYKVNPSISVYATGVKFFQDNDFSFNNFPSERIIVGSEFKIGNTITIGASAGFSRSSNYFPYQHNNPVHLPYYW